jgi:hypothetical protein
MKKEDKIEKNNDKLLKRKHLEIENNINQDKPSKKNKLNPRPKNRNKNFSNDDLILESNNNL